LFVGAVLFVSAGPALAGQASSGELFFYPCTTCHPVSPGAVRSGRKFPNGFTGHEIVLVGHDVLGKGKAACLACHDDPSRDPGKLKSIDGGLVDIQGDVSLVCARCHSAKYAEFKAGVHGKSEPKCTAAGCHDPHTPGFIYAKPQLPFVGTGFQFRARPERVVFTPLASPAPHGIPPVETPVWFAALVVIGAVLAAGLVVVLIQGRSDR
jgi:hypothetical protein